MFQSAALRLQRLRRAAARTALGATLALGGLEYTTHLPSEGRSSAVYHALADQWATPLLRRLLDPEVAHHTALSLARQGLAPRHRPSAVEQRVSVAQTVCGQRFPNPVGLAAGFDKDGEVVQAMLDLGFGFVEVGTVTPRPQPGNRKPRMFRLVEDGAIINRYGFNSLGAEAVRANLEAFRHPPAKENNRAVDDSSAALNRLLSILQWAYTRLFPEQHARGLLGVNIGKNRDTVDAAVDYEDCIRRLGPLADFLVVNISSPNTPGLRDLQTRGLEDLLRRCQAARDALGADPEHRPPLLVKLAPDLSDDELVAVAVVCRELQVDGLVVGNTTLRRPEGLLSPARGEAGGLSGAPLRDRSTECIRQMYRLTDGAIPIIGVGGVGSGRDAFEKLRAGASLVEVYSMMVYDGPGSVSRIRRELAELMLQHGKRSIEDTVGMDHEDIFWRRREAAQVQNRRRLTVTRQPEEGLVTDDAIEPQPKTTV